MCGRRVVDPCVDLLLPVTAETVFLDNVTPWRLDAHTSLRAERIPRAQLSTGTALDVTLRACDRIHLPYLRTDSHHSHDGCALCLALE